MTYAGDKCNLDIVKFFTLILRTVQMRLCLRPPKWFNLKLCKKSKVMLNLNVVCLRINLKAFGINKKTQRYFHDLLQFGIYFIPSINPQVSLENLKDTKRHLLCVMGRPFNKFWGQKKENAIMMHSFILLCCLNIIIHKPVPKQFSQKMAEQFLWCIDLLQIELWHSNVKCQAERLSCIN